MFSLHQLDMTPLHIACEKGFVDIVEALVDGGADIHASGEYVSMGFWLADQTSSDLS